MTKLKEELTKKWLSDKILDKHYRRLEHNMSLQQLNLQCEYRSDQTNTVTDFYVPCLSVSKEYWRAVGYFTSQGLALAARGLSSFLQNEGKMRLVANPLLTEDDILAIQQGYTELSTNKGIR